ncbi:hypothetical protein FPRO04_13694 [Fusarium proliferatum]|nr:hypothetical protein FPRO04_13694 [Fusarium proliferatum]
MATVQRLHPFDIAQASINPSTLTCPHPPRPKGSLKRRDRPDPQQMATKHGRTAKQGKEQQKASSSGLGSRPRYSRIRFKNFTKLYDCGSEGFSTSERYAERHVDHGETFGRGQQSVNTKTATGQKDRLTSWSPLRLQESPLRLQAQRVCALCLPSGYFAKLKDSILCGWVTLTCIYEYLIFVGGRQGLLPQYTTLRDFRRGKESGAEDAGIAEKLQPDLKYTCLDYAELCEYLKIPAQEKPTLTVSYGGETLPFNDSGTFQAAAQALHAHLQYGRCAPRNLSDHATFQPAENLAQSPHVDQNAADAEMQDHEVISIPDDVEDAESPEDDAIDLDSGNDVGDVISTPGDATTHMPETASDPTELEIIESGSPDGLAHEGIMDKMYGIDCLPPRFLAAVTEFFQLNLHQAVLVYRIFLRAREDPESAGHYIADSMGLGKTITTLVVTACLRLAAMIRADIRDHPDGHVKPGSKSGTCHSERKYGVQCLCVPGNPLAVLDDRLSDGPILITASRSVRDNWKQQISKYCCRTIDEVGHPFHGQEFLDPWLLDSSLIPLGTADLPSPPQNGSSSDVWESLRASVKFDLRLRRKKPGSGPLADDMTFEELVDHEESLQYAENEAHTLHPRCQILLVGREKLVSYTKQPQSQLSQKIQVPRDSGAAWVRLVPFSIPFCLVAIDEAHDVHGSASKFIRFLNRLRDRSIPNDDESASIFFLALSGTPIVNKVTDLDSLFGLIVGCSQKVDRFKELTQKLNSTLQRICRRSVASGQPPGPESDQSELISGIVKLLEPIMTARNLDSVFLGSHRVNIDIPELKSFRSYFETPQRWHESHHALTRKARSEIATVEPNGVKIQELARIKSGSFHLLLRGAYCAPLPHLVNFCEDGFPFLSSDVDKDISLGRSSKILSLAHVYGRDDRLYDELNRIIKAAARRTIHKCPERAPVDRPRDVIIFGAFPITCAVLFAHVKHHLSDLAEVHLVLSNSPTDREAYLEKLARRSLTPSRSKSIVLISTPGVLGQGNNSLTFCSVLVKCGDIFNPTAASQCLARVRRPGQQHDTVAYFELIRGDNQANHVVRFRNHCRYEAIRRSPLLQLADDAQ